MSSGIMKFLIPAAATMLLGPAGAFGISGVGSGVLSAGGAALAGGLASLALGGFGGQEGGDQSQYPTAPGVDPNAIAQREAVAEEERRRRVASRQNINPTGGLGDTTQANASVKSLLGT